MAVSTINGLFIKVIALLDAIDQMVYSVTVYSEFEPTYIYSSVTAFKTCKL